MTCISSIADTLTELHHVFGKVAHFCPAFCSIGKLGSYVVGSVDSLAGTEGTFDFVSVSDGLCHVVVIFGLPGLFGWPAERLAVGLNLIGFPNKRVWISESELSSYAFQL